MISSLVNSKILILEPGIYFLIDTLKRRVFCEQTYCLLIEIFRENNGAIVLADGSLLSVSLDALKEVL